ncbi:ATP-binding protein [Pseudonocardia sp. N23]|uniref:ATP-binding protein n=1 Tax=Pseudonocardia sp. N23 TaxID=1987376 RepID=UPI000BFE6D7C|nr:ATP-binding protein [Pseudonocardia sp. N23]GAY08033.1 serine phosphatase RsbU, regulator of sigma subunit [Pseudonocardia sp. N23]
MVTQLQLRVDAQPAELGLVRRAVQTWLAAQEWPVSAADALVFAVVEAFGNSVEHAYSGFDEGRVTIDVAVESTAPGRRRATAVVADAGRWRDQGARPGGRGNGLALIRSIALGMSVATDAAGTRVTVWTDDEELLPPA